MFITQSTRIVHPPWKFLRDEFIFTTLIDETRVLCLI